MCGLLKYTFKPVGELETNNISGTGFAYLTSVNDSGTMNMLAVAYVSIHEDYPTFKDCVGSIESINVNKFDEVFTKISKEEFYKWE